MPVPAVGTTIAKVDRRFALDHKLVLGERLGASGGYSSTAEAYAHAATRDAQTGAIAVVKDGQRFYHHALAVDRLFGADGAYHMAADGEVGYKMRSDAVAMIVDGAVAVYTDEARPRFDWLVPAQERVNVRGVDILALQRPDRPMITRMHLMDALLALDPLPQEDLDLLRQHSLAIQLHPGAVLDEEQASNHGNEALIGATTVVSGRDGRATPTKIRVAAHAEGHPVPEIIQHEIGHALAVLRNQDKSEAAAEAYAARY